MGHIFKALKERQKMKIDIIVFTMLMSFFKKIVDNICYFLFYIKQQEEKKNERT